MSVTLFFRGQVFLTAPANQADQEFVGLVLQLGFKHREEHPNG